MQELPEKLKTTAILQVVSGALNLMIMWWVVSMTAGLVGGVCTGIITLGACPIGVVCGLPGYLLIPIGIFELVAGIMGLTNAGSAGKVMRVAAWVELASLLVGGLLSAAAGVFGLLQFKEPEVVGYLEGY